MADPLRTRILLVDDDIPARKSLSDYLELSEKYTTTEIESGAQAIASIKADNFDVILVGSSLIDMNDREFCSSVRAKDIQIPIIILSSRCGEADQIFGLEAGANDYLTKPVSPGVLVARLKTYSRNMWSGDQARIRIGPYIFRPAKKILDRIDGDEIISLTDKEFSVLKLLVEAGEIGISNQMLYVKVWGDLDYHDSHVLATTVYRLRQKLKSDSTQSKLLVSIPGGYRLLFQS